MAPFIFKSGNHFVASSDGTTLQVYELTKPLIHPSSIRNIHWNEVAKINIGLHHDTNEGISYNGLLFFDGHGRIQGRATLTTLAQHLMLLRLRVSPEGYCFQDVTDLGNYVDFGIHYLCLNDLFCWPRHGVELVTITKWHRWDLEYHYRPRNEKTSKSLTGNVVSKEKYLELKKLLEDEHEELEKLKEEMNEANETKNEELQSLKREKDEGFQKVLRKKDEVFQKVLSKKDEEIKMLKRKKNNDEGENLERIAELVKLKEELEEANEIKDEELQKLRKEKEEELKKKIKMKEDELRFLKNKKDNEDAKAKRMEELEKLIEEMEEINQIKDQEIQKLRNDISEEIHKRLEIVRKKDGAAKARKMEELEKMKDQMEKTYNANKDEELRKLRNEQEEKLQKILKEKENELQILKNQKDDEEKTKEEKTKRIEELEKINGDMKVANKERDDEIQKLRKENNEETQNILRAKDDNDEKAKRIEELERMNKELKKVKDEELRKLTLEKEEELRKIVKQNDDELQVVNMKKDDEKAKRIEGLERMNKELKKVKDEELRKLTLGKEEELRKIVKQKDDELQVFERKNDDEKAKKIEELERMNKELKKVKDEELRKLTLEKEEELRKIVKRKDDELQVFKRKNDGEKNEKEEKLKRIEDELKKVNYTLSSSVVDVTNFKKQLEECRKNSWAYSSVSAFLPTNSEGERKHRARRRHVPSDKIIRKEVADVNYSENIPNLTTGINVNVYHTLYCVDDEDITELRPPSAIYVYVSKGGTGGFDVSNWWFTKATHPEGGLTMLAYYDGSYSKAPHANGPVPLPFSKDVKTIIPAQNVFMVDLKPIGVRMAFAYRW
ncbi:Laminin subunit alpha-2 [Linum perenne]